jgi:hypothetical protein
MEHPLPQSYASHTVSGPWSPYQDHVVDYAAGDSYLTAHHVQVDGEQGSCGSSYQASYAQLSALSTDPHATPLSTNNMNISISKLM